MDITAGWSKYVVGDNYQMDNTWTLNVALKLPSLIKHPKKIEVNAVPQQDPPKVEIKPAAATQPGEIKKVEPPKKEEKVKKEAASSYIEHAVQAGKTLHDILTDELQKIKAARGDNSRVTKEEYDKYLKEFKKLNIGSDGMMDSYNEQQKSRAASLAAKYRTAGDPLHWVFVGQKIKLPAAYNNVRIEQKGSEPVRSAGNDVPSQKKAAPDGNNNVGIKRSLFSLVKEQEPAAAAEDHDEKTRASRAADQLMALLTNRKLI